MSEDAKLDKTIKTAGGVAFSSGINHAVTGATGNPLLGKVAGAAASFAPDRAKAGATVGGIVGGSIAGHAITAGAAGAFAWGVAAFVPLSLGGAVIVGGLAWLLGDDEPTEKKAS